MDAIGRLGWIQIDCADPMAQATFWGGVLGQEVGRALGDPAHYVGLVPTVPGAPEVSFQRVPEPKAVKNRLHMDIAVDDVDAAAVRVVELGGSIVPREDVHEYGFSWRLAADPEGNELCLVYGVA
jgi:predicted enzyme related to lactoylglutathione lyase